MMMRVIINGTVESCMAIYLGMAMEIKANGDQSSDTSCRIESMSRGGVIRLLVRTPIPGHIDLAGNTSYHFAASRTVFPWVSP